MQHGVDPAEVVICHIDVELDGDCIRALLQKGVFVEFDKFGQELYIDPADLGFAGGVFARDIEHVPMMMDEGISRETIDNVLRDNPQRPVI